MLCMSNWLGHKGYIIFNSRLDVCLVLGYLFLCSVCLLWLFRGCSVVNLPLHNSYPVQGEQKSYHVAADHRRMDSHMRIKLVFLSPATAPV